MKNNSIKRIKINGMAHIVENTNTSEYLINVLYLPLYFCKIMILFLSLNKLKKQYAYSIKKAVKITDNLIVPE